MILGVGVTEAVGVTEGVIEGVTLGVILAVGVTEGVTDGVTLAVGVTEGVADGAGITGQFNLNCQSLLLRGLNTLTKAGILSL